MGGPGVYAGERAQPAPEVLKKMLGTGAAIVTVGGQTVMKRATRLIELDLHMIWLGMHTYSCRRTDGLTCRGLPLDY